MNTWSRALVAMSVVLGLAACAAPELDGIEGKRSSRSNLDSKWTPPESDATGSYEGLNGEGCSGGLKSGTKAVGDQIKEQFGVSYGGYSCRANTANTKELSIHAVGRALDIMVGQGSSKGDEVANYLVENASALGITLIIWNRTVWRISENGPSSRAYTGPNPHTDHVHAEVSSAVAASGPGETSDPNSSGTDDMDGTDPDATNPDGTDPDGTDPDATNPDGTDDPWGEDPWGEDPWGGDYDNGPYSEENEAECYSDLDCDPSGQLICDQGYCSW